MARGRPAQPLGTFGHIRFEETKAGTIKATAQVRLRNGTRKKIRRHGQSKNQAEQRLKQAAAEALGTADTADLTTTSEIGTLLDYWIEHHDMSAASRSVYVSTIDRHIRPAIGQIRINETTTALMDGFISSITGPATAKRARSILSSAFGMATRFNLVESNTIRETLSPKQAKSETRTLTADEFRTVRDMARHFTTSGTSGPTLRGAPFPNIVDFIAGTGVRIGEALRLKWDDLDLAATPPTAQIHVTKTGDGSPRTIQLPSIAADAVAAQKELTGQAFDYVFPTGTGQAITPSNVSRWFRDARKAWAKSEKSAGRTDVSWVTPHTFRRTVATWLAEKVSLHAASQQLGHADTVVTEHHYISKPNAGPPVAAVLDTIVHGALNANEGP